MNDLQSHIQSTFGVPDQHLSVIQKLFVQQTISKGEFHTKKESFHSNLSFLKSGYMRIYAPFDDKDVTQWISSPGEFVTDLSCLMFGQPARYNIVALTDCVLYSISSENYRKINHLIPEWDRLEKMFLSKCFLQIEERIFSFLSLTAEQRYHHLFNAKRDLFNQIPLNYIASMLGMTPETFSRIRRKSIS